MDGHSGALFVYFGGTGEKKMNFRQSLLQWMLSLLFLISLSGCFSNYGKLAPVSADGDMITIQELEDNWRDYKMYYAVWPADQPVAILFDPKGDMKNLVAEDWIEVRPGKDSLTRIINSIHSRYEPGLYNILGPKNEVYGYVYSGLSRVTVEVIDVDTLRVHDVDIPPPSDV